MRAQLSRHRPPLHDLFQLSVQLMDLRREPVEQVEQVLPASAGPSCQWQRFQFGPTRWPPQCFLAPQSFVERHHVQLIHDARAHLHQPVAMPEQLPQIAILRVRHPDSREAIFQQQPQ